MISGITGNTLYVNGKSVSPLEFETYSSLYVLKQESSNYYVTKQKKVLHSPVSNVVQVVIQDVSGASDNNNPISAVPPVEKEETIPIVSSKKRRTT